MKKIHVSLSNRSISVAINALENYKKYILRKTEQLLTELANEGVSIVSLKFSTALYAGDNDVSVKFEQRGENKVAVVATGNATLFIEFGTGVTYKAAHPLADESGMNRGEYGHKLGSLPGGWRYKGNPGNVGEVITQGKHKGEIHTYGNPANMSMYQTERELEQKFTEIAKKVFNDG